MPKNLMILHSKDEKKIRLVKFPSDFEKHEVYRFATGVIAGVEESMPDYNWDDILEVLEEHGFEEVDFILGPEL